MGAMWMRMKAHRWAYTLNVLATLALGILIGTVISYGVKGKEGQKSDAAPLSLPSPQQLSNAFSQIAKQLGIGRASVYRLLKSERVAAR